MKTEIAIFALAIIGIQCFWIPWVIDITITKHLIRILKQIERMGPLPPLDWRPIRGTADIMNIITDHIGEFEPPITGNSPCKICGKELFYHINRKIIAERKLDPYHGC